MGILKAAGFALGAPSLCLVYILGVTLVVQEKRGMSLAAIGSWRSQQLSHAVGDMHDALLRQLVLASTAVGVGGKLGFGCRRGRGPSRWEQRVVPTRSVRPRRMVLEMAYVQGDIDSNNHFPVNNLTGDCPQRLRDLTLTGWLVGHIVSSRWDLILFCLADSPSLVTTTHLVLWHST